MVFIWCWHHVNFVIKGVFMGKYIESIYAKNIGKYKEAKVIFNPRFNFLVGANGCGKTTILKYMAIILNPTKANVFRYGNNATVWTDYNNNGKKIRIGLGEGWVEKGTDYRKATHRIWKAAQKDEYVLESYAVNDLEKNKIDFAPLILGAYRRIQYKEIEGMKKETLPAQKRQDYRNRGIDSLEGGYLPDVKQWMINRYFEIEKEWAHNYKQNWDWIIGNLNAVSPYGDNFLFKEIKKDLEPIFILNGKECYLEELSAGFQAALSLIFAIVEWIESVNEENNILIQQAEGTVFIDELDVHLHPEWQIIVRDMLDKVFPKLQFILTTHSPHLIANALPGEIIKIPSGDDTIDIGVNDKSYSGWSTDEILEDVMEVKNLENKEYNMALKEAMGFIVNKDIENIKRSIEKLEQIVHPNNTIVNEMKIKLAEIMLEE